MKLSLPIIVSLFASVAQASDFFDEHDRELFPFFGGKGGIRGAGGPGGPPPMPDTELDCTGLLEPCTPRRPGATFEPDSGTRVCIQHPEDPDKSKTICLVPDDEDVVMVFSENDSCGCCGGECPTSCDAEDACSCSGTKRNGETFDDGYTMTVTRPGMFGDVEVSMCLPAELTVDAKLRGATCVKTTCG